MKGIFKKISDRDVTIEPFKVYKSWAFETTGSLETYGIDRLAAIKPNSPNYTGNIVTISSSQVNTDSASLLLNTSNNKEASIIWYSLNHLYYKNAANPYDTFGNPDPYSIERTLFDEASVLSVPQKRFGEKIKPKSVILQLQNNSLSTGLINLVDDGNGNLIDTALSSSISNQILYLRTNEETYNSNWTNSTVIGSYTTEILDVKHKSTNKELTVTSKNVRLGPKVVTDSWGNASYFYDNSYIRIPNLDTVNFKQSDDYSVTFWTTRDPVANSVPIYILSKRSTGKNNVSVKRIVDTVDSNTNSSQYPFDICYLSGSGNLSCKYSTGTSTIEVTGSITADYTRHHVVLQKTGSTFQLYIDGTLQNSKTVPAGNIQNNADIFIGSLGLDSNGDGVNGFRGSVDEFMMFNKGLSQSEINQLYDTSINTMSTNTNIVGNVFYDHGIIVVSDPRPKYGTPKYRLFNDVLYNKNTGIVQPSYLNAFYLEYNSTVTLYGHEYTCKINEDEFNYTFNPTIRLNDDPNSQIPKAFVTGSEFGPYITTVGLYNNKAELVAIGKLASPIKKRDNVDLNIIVRFDV
jgi:hypothetical protein